jgi:hypothetical protein
MKGPIFGISLWFCCCYDIIWHTSKDLYDWKSVLYESSFCEFCLEPCFCNTLWSALEVEFLHYSHK